jgi:putative membrane protein
MMDWADNSGWSLWWMLPMMLFMVVLVGAVIWALIAVAGPRTTSTAASARRTAEDILNERFARGEIDASEYRERIDAIRGSAPAKR